ncbi:kinase-like domain-containing protein [Obelidium mucronatum]|nr:kinase-like domain-containing protein [Obelidium mucronatum]
MQSPPKAQQLQQQPQPSASTRHQGPPPPAVIHDRKQNKSYKTGRLLGEGGFARCYEVTTSDGEKLAAKIIRKSSLTSQKQKQKLFAEIRIHQQMSHPAIVAFQHVFEDDENVYIILELCENGTMIDFLKHRKRLTEPEVRYYMHHLLHGVSYMHHHRVIHRDLKLGNMFLAKEMRLKIELYCGTPNYIAPEVLFGTQTGGHSFEVDMWSLGVVMYTQLIGKPPFQTKDVKEIYKKIKKTDYTYPPSLPISQQAKFKTDPPVEEVLQFDFFTMEPIPYSIPVSALARVPTGGNGGGSENKRGSFGLLNGSAAKPLLPAGGSGGVARTTHSPRTVSGSLQPQQQRSPQHQQRFAVPAAVEVNYLKMSSAGGRHSGEDVENRSGQRDSAARGISGSNDGGLKGKGKLPESSAQDQIVALQKSSLANQENASPVHQPSPRKYPPQESEQKQISLSTYKPAQEVEEQLRIPLLSIRHEVPLETMYRNIRDAFATMESGDYRAQDFMQRPALQPDVFITKWIDYSNKYGLGYQLQDGTIGVYFNDSTSILLSSDNNHFEYLYYEAGTDGSRMHRKPHTMSTYPSDLQKKVTLLKHFGSYMQDNLFQGVEGANGVATPKTSDLIFLTKYLRTRHGVIFRLSNQVVQINLFDHTKLILSQNANVITYIDKNREMTTRSLLDFLASKEREVVDRLTYAKDILQQMIVKKAKKSGAAAAAAAVGGGGA